MDGKKNKKETDEETYRLNMAFMEAIHNGAELYVKRKWWML